MSYNIMKSLGALDQTGPQACANSGGEWDLDSNTCLPAYVAPAAPAQKSPTAVYVVLGLGLVGLAVYISARKG